MRGKMFTAAKVARVRRFRCHRSLRHRVAETKKRLRRMARRAEAAAIRRGEYDYVAFGLNERGVI